MPARSRGQAARLARLTRIPPLTPRDKKESADEARWANERDAQLNARLRDAQARELQRAEAERHAPADAPRTARDIERVAGGEQRGARSGTEAIRALLTARGIAVPEGAPVLDDLAEFFGRQR